MNSRKQIGNRVTTPHARKVSETLTPTTPKNISSGFKKLHTLLSSPTSNSSNLLPFRTISNISIPSFTSGDKIQHNKKNKHFRNINQSETAQQPCLNTSNRNKSISNLSLESANIRYQKQSSGNFSQFQNSSPIVLKGQCLVSTIIPQRYILKIIPQKKIQVPKQLFEDVNYRMVQSNVFASSQTIQMQESIINQRQILQDFILYHQIAKNQNIAIQQNIGLCLVIKRVPIDDLDSIISQSKHLSIEHPTIIKTYQTVINNNIEFVCLKEYFQQYFSTNPLKYSVKQIIAFILELTYLFQFFTTNNLLYTGNVLNNLVVCNFSCKLIVYEDQLISTPNLQKYPVLQTYLIQFLINIQTITQNKKKDYQQFSDILKLFKNSISYEKIIAHLLTKL